MKEFMYNCECTTIVIKPMTIIGIIINISCYTCVADRTGGSCQVYQLLIGIHLYSVYGPAYCNLKQKLKRRSYLFVLNNGQCIIILLDTLKYIYFNLVVRQIYQTKRQIYQTKSTCGCIVCAK